MQYIQLTDAEDSETIEVPCEDDGTLTVSSLAAHYPGATGLKYRINGHVRAVKLSNGKLYPPEGGWKDLTYYCIFPKETTKRKADDAIETSESKSTKVDSDSKWVHTDLVVLGLPWKTTDKELRDYFSKFGDLQLAQVKIDPISKKSKGYGFVRFTDKEVQVRVMLQRHQIDGRWCDVRVPVSKDTVGKKSPYKVFIGQCTEDLTEDILREYFSQFGEISDLYVPKPFRAFAFVTFVESNAAKTVCAQEHQINDTKVYVTEAVPKGETDKFERSRSRSGAKNSKRGDSYYSGGSANYDDYYDSRRPWSGGREDNWRERWNDEPSYKDNSWRPKSSGWTSSTSNNRWRDSGAPTAGDPNIDPDVVAQVVNKAVLGVIGNLKSGHSAPVSDMTSNGGGGYGKKDEWWSRR
ncbi:hypothetical protein V9T40_004114 [Parthenolecanium corni]|uniref:RRM domain-containing protein n=1 Tax=Parthenolecanium corni TaxID=536013 RepID=A0AAN9TVJ3_9HEMI